MINRPIYSTDVALFSVVNGSLRVLLTKRAKSVREADKWALPGGVVDYLNKETSEIKAKKVIKNKLGIKDHIFLERVNIYDEIDRDPDEYSISVCYLSLIDENRVSLLKGDGVSEIKWFNISSVPKLAFDHNEMVKDSVEYIRNSLKDTSVGFKFLPKEFTIPQLRKIYENILDINLNPSNFRTRLLSLNILEPCDRKKRVDLNNKKIKGQPAKLYRVKEEFLEKVVKTHNLFLDKGVL